MKEYLIHLGDRDTLNKDLKPLRRKSLLYLILGAAGTIFGINQLAKSSYVSGRVDVMSDIQTEIDERRLVESMEEKEEQ